MIKILDALGRQRWLDPLGDQLQRLVTVAFESLGPDTRGLKNLLHGTWLGHPLHPVMTDVALGGWTTAVALDAVDEVGGDETLAAGADIALGLGLLGALGSAATGLNDWQHTDGTGRRLGTAHAVLNGTATLLFVGSLLARLAENRSLGRQLARLGLGVSMASAYIGGDLVYGSTRLPRFARTSADRWRKANWRMGASSAPGTAPASTSRMEECSMARPRSRSRASRRASATARLRCVPSSRRSRAVPDRDACPGLVAGQSDAL